MVKQINLIEMNRVILAFLLFFASSIESFSNPVDTETAKKVAQNFMNRSCHTSKTILDVVVERFKGQNSFYVVNFREGGWVMVSADDSTVPVFAFSLDDTYRIDNEKPDAFLDMVSEYKEQVDLSRKMGSTRSNETIESWNQLTIADKGNTITRSSTITQKAYTTGGSLLNDPVRGFVSWGQDINNQDHCYPSYNAYAPLQTIIPGCDCGRDPAGCGPVAMGQVMWYWQWPKTSSYRTYDWNLMTAEIFDVDIAQGDAIAHLLRDCGLAANTMYSCLGSATTLNNIEDGLKSKFNFKAARKADKSDWNSSVWIDLMRTEIDCERPVIYRGDESGLISTEKHIFVLDGYFTVLNLTFFHINFGWRGFEAWHLLNDISGTTPGGSSYEYGKNQGAIIGVSPTYPMPSSVNITDVSYTSVTGVKLEEAQQNITLPATGKSLTVENGGNLTLVAGNTITLGPGFHAKPGSQFTTKIEPTYAVNMEIAVSSWYYAMMPSSGGLWLWVNNANSYDFIVWHRTGAKIHQQAGVITDVGSIGIWDRVDLWDGLGFPEDVYTCSIRIRNNFGRTIEKTWTVALIYQRSSTILNDSINTEYQKLFSPAYDFSENPLITEADVVVYPNPNSGTVNIKINKSFFNYNLKIYNINGTIVHEDEKVTHPTYSFDMSGFVDGTYLLQLVIDNQLVTKKIILAR